MPVSHQYQSVFRADLFAGKVALVTGGGTGIGRCIAHELAFLGAHVVVAGRRPDPLEQTVAEIAQSGGAASAIVLDIRDQEAVLSQVTQIVADHGSLDLLVNNAGGQFMSGAEDIRPKGWRAVIDTNLNGTFWVTQAAFHAWMGDNGGSIVNIIADMRNGFPGMSHTGAARAAVDNLTKTLAVEWACHGIRINAIAPGVILSSGMKTYPKSVLEMIIPMMKRTPSARLGTEAEVSAAAVYFLSPAAAFTTGATLRLDGGSSLAKVPMMPLDEHDRMPAWSGFHLDVDAPDELS
ncbi:MAG: SDR family oxidoreductase [Myxococcales bacterium]|nr:SDR family oxidoreductase [Myxococcales bacterium]